MTIKFIVIIILLDDFHYANRTDKKMGLCTIPCLLEVYLRVGKNFHLKRGRTLRQLYIHVHSDSALMYVAIHDTDRKAI